jgi:hypothetical protein
MLSDKLRQFDLVLTEVVMPGLSGIQLLSRIQQRDQHKRMPVISEWATHFLCGCVWQVLMHGANRCVLIVWGFCSPSLSCLEGFRFLQIKFISSEGCLQLLMALFW